MGVFNTPILFLFLFLFLLKCKDFLSFSVLYNYKCNFICTLLALKSCILSVFIYLFLLFHSYFTNRVINPLIKKKISILIE